MPPRAELMDAPSEEAELHPELDQDGEIPVGECLEEDHRSGHVAAAAVLGGKRELAEPLGRELPDRCQRPLSRLGGGEAVRHADPRVAEELEDARPQASLALVPRHDPLERRLGTGPFALLGRGRCGLRPGEVACRLPPRTPRSSSTPSSTRIPFAVAHPPASFASARAIATPSDTRDLSSSAEARRAALPMLSLRRASACGEGASRS